MACSRCGEMESSITSATRGTLLLVYFICRACQFKTQWNSQLHIFRLIYPSTVTVSDKLVSWVRVCTVFSFFVIHIASLETKNEHCICFSVSRKRDEKRLQTDYLRFPNMGGRARDSPTNRCKSLFVLLHQNETRNVTAAPLVFRLMLFVYVLSGLRWSEHPCRKCAHVRRIEEDGNCNFYFVPWKQANFYQRRGYGCRQNKPDFSGQRRDNVLVG